MAEVPEINEAFLVANQANLTSEEFENLEARKIYIAKRLLEFLDAETVSQNSGLSLEEVQCLREQ